jgi:hypothetical protein
MKHIELNKDLVNKIILDFNLKLDGLLFKEYDSFESLLSMGNAAKRLEERGFKTISSYLSPYAHITEEIFTSPLGNIKIKNYKTHNYIKLEWTNETLCK